MRLASAVRREVWAVDRNIALSSTDTLTNYLMQYTLCDAALQSHPARRVCERGSGAGGDRGLQRNCVYGDASDSRDLDSDGAGGGRQARVPYGVGDGSAADRDR